MAKASAAAPGTAGSNYPIIKDEAAIKAAEDYKSKYAESKRLEAELKVLKATVVQAMGGAPKAIFGVRIVEVKQVDAIEPTENRRITKEMIGQVIEGKSGRAGYPLVFVK